NQHIPHGDGHFAQLDQMDQLDLETKLERRQGIPCSVQNLGAVARILYPGNSIKGPGHISQALQFIADTEAPFSLRELPFISDKNKVKLAARLIRGGLLKVSAT
ncbi:MAG: hypothetical protein AAF206_20595, partial [Bacteroidota bacterium]